jgi:hypothetical protein
MREHRPSIKVNVTLAAFIVLLFATSTYAQQEKVLFNFNLADGANPYGNLIFDKAGNLYGTTYTGGAEGSRTVFELLPSMSGGWTQKMLHSFKYNGKDGSNPDAGLIFDAAGNLYGTARSGAVNQSGTVFELIPEAGGVWRGKVLHSFTSDRKRDGAVPAAGLISDAAGNFSCGTSVTSCVAVRA